MAAIPSAPPRRDRDGGCVVAGASAGCGVGWAGGSDAGCDGTGGVLLGGSGAGCCPGACGLVLGGVVDGDWALPTAGRPSTAAVARVVVHRVIERFIRAPPEHGVDENEAFSVRSVLKSSLPAISAMGVPPDLSSDWRASCADEVEEMTDELHSRWCTDYPLKGAMERMAGAEVRQVAAAG